jgi:hypothetical protein
LAHMILEGGKSKTLRLSLERAFMLHWQSGQDPMASKPVWEDGKSSIGKPPRAFYNWWSPQDLNTSL